MVKKDDDDFLIQGWVRRTKAATIPKQSGHHSGAKRPPFRTKRPPLLSGRTSTDLMPER
jgi:hypothetical protein